MERTARHQLSLELFYPGILQIIFYPGKYQPQTLEWRIWTTKLDLPPSTTAAGLRPVPGAK